MTTLTFNRLPLIPQRFYHGAVVLDVGTLTKICGENGVGKSSFFYYCQQNEQELFQQNISFLDQKAIKPLNNYTLHEVKVVLADHWQNFLIKDWRIEWDRMIHELELVQEQKVHELSGGQNQLLKLMITSLLDSSLYLWDEPFQCLDPKRTEWWLVWIKTKLKTGKTFLIIDHSDKLNGVAKKIYELAFSDMNNVYFKQVNL